MSLFSAYDNVGQTTYCLNIESKGKDAPQSEIGTKYTNRVVGWQLICDPLSTPLSVRYQAIREFVGKTIGSTQIEIK